MKGKRTSSAWQRFALGLPYAWLLAFFLVPFLIVLKISLSQTAIAQPPYTPVLDLAGGWQGLKAFFAALSLENYGLLGSDPLYLLSYVKSMRSPRSRRSCCSASAIRSPTRSRARRGAGRRCWSCSSVLPFWTSLLIRIYSWMNILQREGPLNELLMALSS